MLNMLEPFDLAALGKNSSNYVHLVAEVMKLAFADRAAHLGDADFHPVPIEQLTSKAYAESRLAQLRFPPTFGQRPAWQAGAPFTIEVQAGSVTPPDDAGTTHISVIDRDGNAIAITQTINTIFGSGITVPGTGIVLNNEMDDFSVAADTPNSWQAVGDSANAVAPGKRPLSSMSPTLVMKDGQVQMVVGSPMGTMIISSVLLAITNVIDFGMNAEQAVQSPRFHHQWKPETLFLEPEFTTDVKAKLEAWGHSLGSRQIMGAAELIVFDTKACYYRGGADGRRDSGAMAANLALDAEPGKQRAACLVGIR
jgi:gamma-glutamyltranspeptidase/glutathione hydrolase